jgi:anti-sigma factor RsiW
MDCREFGKKHLAFVDDTLSAVDTAAMRRHLHVCSRCARHDTRIRRGLLLARNLPMIQPSADFMERLNARLRELGPIDRYAVATLSSACRRSSPACPSPSPRQRPLRAPSTLRRS